MTNRFTSAPRERYSDHAGASGLHVAHAPHGRYGGRATVGSLAVGRGRYGGLTLPPVVHERYGGLAPPCERLRTHTSEKIKYN